MVNLKPASVQMLSDTVEYIQEESKERPILVHCLAGQGRTGMVLAAYLVRTKGMSTDQAVLEVRRLRPNSITREVQVEAVRRYEEHLRGKIPGQELP